MNFSTALVTGATSGLGFEAAAQLADQGVNEVVITGRSQAIADEARRKLIERTGKDVFSTLAMDLSDLASVEAAAAARSGQDAFDLLVLNAGIVPSNDLLHTGDGIEMTVAASLTGHHLLTMRLLEHDLLSSTARIVIAGSEAARGDVPTFTPADITKLADTHFGGDPEAAVLAYMRMDSPIKYNPSNTYATAKLFVAWWAAELAGRLPQGMTVNAVSPGSTPDTDAARNAPAYMTYLMLPIIKLIPGMSHGVADGAGRYLEVAGYDDSKTGLFYASKPKKMTGKIESITLPIFANPAAQKAVWNVTTQVTGAGASLAH